MAKQKLCTILESAVKALLAHGVDAEIFDRDGQTLIVVKHGREEVVYAATVKQGLRPNTLALYLFESRNKDKP